MNKFLKLFGFLLIFSLFAFMPTNDKIKIVIDAGHGGTDLGGTSSKEIEKEIVASIAAKINNLNTYDNIELHFTREDDNLITLKERVDFINKLNPDLVISIHANNSLNKATSGIECYVAKEEIANSQKSKEYAENLLKDFTEKMNLKSRGVKQAPFFILKNSAVPVVLLEVGYLSNENDRKYLTKEKSQTEIAKTILNFVSSIKK